MRQRVGDWISGRKSSSNWFLEWARISEEEDAALGGVTIANAYKTVAWVNIAIAARARNLARAPLKFYAGDGDTEVESGPVYELFLRHGAQLWEATEGWRCMRGEAIWILGWGGQVGFPQQIVVVDPTLMECKLDPTGTKVILWTYNGQTKIPFKPEEVVHFPMWNPYDAIRGMPELTPVLEELNQEYLTARATKQLLNNQSIPGGIITIPGDEMSEEQAERVISKWEKKHKGVNRAGRVAVLGSGATYEKISLSPQEMQTFEQRGWNRETILAKYGVPHAVVGIKDAASTLSGKDTQEQMRAFWNLTLIPECKYFQKKLEQDFFARFKLSMTAEFDYESLWEMQDDQKELAERLRLDVQAGVLTQNEAREIRGMDPVEWGDTWWRPMALVDTTGEYEPIEVEVPAEPSPFESKPPKEEEEEEPSKKAITIIHKGRPSIYTPDYRVMRWKMQHDPALNIEIRFTRALKSEFYRMRRQQLHSLMEYGGTQAIQHSHLADLTGEPMWETYHKMIAAEGMKYLTEAVDLAGDEMKRLFRDLGLEMAGAFDIWDTRAPEMLQYRVNQGSLSSIDKTIQDDLRKKLGDAIERGSSVQEAADDVRLVWNKAGNRAPTIARTEIAGAIEDSRIASFKEEGFTKHEWLSARDELVRTTPFNHAIDGEVQRIGEAFSNGLVYPHDPAGEAGNVINCRCDTLPLFEE